MSTKKLSIPKVIKFVLMKKLKYFNYNNNKINTPSQILKNKF